MGWHCVLALLLENQLILDNKELEKIQKNLKTPQRI